MRLYPNAPGRRAATLAGDALVVLLVVLFAWLGLRVHDAVDELAGLGRGVSGAGTSVRDALSSAGEAVEGTPLVGGGIAGALREAGGGSDEVARLGREGEQSVHDLADLLGFVTFLVPTVLLLSRSLPGRLRQVRNLTAAATVLQAPQDPDRQRLIATRAALALPYGRLLRHTSDPLGDLDAGRYDGLVAAALEDAGLSRRRRVR